METATPAAPAKAGPVTHAPGAVYGYCPKCGAAGEMRERRPNGNDRCQRGHSYPSATATRHVGGDGTKDAAHKGRRLVRK